MFTIRKTVSIPTGIPFWATKSTWSAGHPYTPQFGVGALHARRLPAAAEAIRFLPFRGAAGSGRLLFVDGKTCRNVADYHAGRRPVALTRSLEMAYGAPGSSARASQCLYAHSSLSILSICPILNTAYLKHCVP